jgi:hypothetical protein
MRITRMNRRGLLIRVRVFRPFRGYPLGRRPSSTQSSQNFALIRGHLNSSANKRRPFTIRRKTSSTSSTLRLNLTRYQLSQAPTNTRRPLTNPRPRPWRSVRPEAAPINEQLAMSNVIYSLLPAPCSLLTRRPLPPTPQNML